MEFMGLCSIACNFWWGCLVLARLYNGLRITRKVITRNGDRRNDIRISALSGLCLVSF